MKGPWLDPNICSLLQGCLQEEMEAVVMLLGRLPLCMRSNEFYLALEKQTIGKKPHGDASGLSILIGKG